MQKIQKKTSPSKTDGKKFQMTVSLKFSILKSWQFDFTWPDYSEIIMEFALNLKK